MYIFDQRHDPEAQEKYLGWRLANLNAFVLNCAQHRWLIHRATCSHLEEFKSGKAHLVRHPKACSHNREELETWAMSYGMTHVETCRSCIQVHSKRGSHSLHSSPTVPAATMPAREGISTLRQASPVQRAAAPRTPGAGSSAPDSNGAILGRNCVLWQREDLATLRSFASAPGFVARSLGMDHVVAIERWMVRFPPAVPARLSPRSGKGTYHIKPLVAIHDEPLFGELAIVRCLQQDGWSAVWVDTFHGAELFWDALPDRSRPVAFAEDSGVLATYRQIVSANGRRGGFFDVLAWRECEFLFIEYKGKGDTANANEAAWIEAALSCGVITTQLLFAVHA